MISSKIFLTIILFFNYKLFASEIDNYLLFLEDISQWDALDEIVILDKEYINDNFHINPNKVLNYEIHENHLIEIKSNFHINECFVHKTNFDNKWQIINKTSHKNQMIYIKYLPFYTSIFKPVSREFKHLKTKSDFNLWCKKENNNINNIYLYFEGQEVFKNILFFSFILFLFSILMFAFFKKKLNNDYPK